MFHFDPLGYIQPSMNSLSQKFEVPKSRKAHNLQVGSLGITRETFYARELESMFSLPP